MKHDKYDYSGYCCDTNENPLTKKDRLFFWAVIGAGVAVWSGLFFLTGYSIGAGQ